MKFLDGLIGAVLLIIVFAGVYVSHLPGIQRTMALVVTIVSIISAVLIVGALV